jgi:hypothetical protein
LERIAKDAPAGASITNFKVQACIDWIDLEFDLGRPTQFQWVQREVRRILHPIRPSQDTSKPAFYIGGRSFWVEP